MNIIFWLGFKKDPVGIYPKTRLFDEAENTNYELVNSKIEIKAETDLIIGHIFDVSEYLLFKDQERTYENLRKSVKSLIKNCGDFEEYLERFEKEDLLDWENILIYKNEESKNLFEYKYFLLHHFMVCEMHGAFILDGIARYPKSKYHTALSTMEECDRLEEKRKFEEEMGNLYKYKIFFLGFKGCPNEKINKDTDLIVGHVQINNYETEFPHLVRETILSYPENLDKFIKKFDEMGVLDWDNILLIDNKHYYNGGIALNLMSRGVPKIFNLEPIKHPKKDEIDYSKIFEGVYRFDETPYETAKKIMESINDYHPSLLGL